MGSIISLSVGNLEIDCGKNSSFFNHSILFQPDDIRDVDYFYAADDDEESNPNGYTLMAEQKEGYSKPLQDVLPRLELLGFTLNGVEQLYSAFVRECEYYEISDGVIPFDRLVSAISKVGVQSVSLDYSEDHGPGRFAEKEIIDRLGLQGVLDELSIYPRD